MVRPASFDGNGMKKGAWSEEEDNKLRACMSRSSHLNWRLVPFAAGLKRCGKSCRLRWVNYLKPGLRRGNFTKDEELLIIELHNQLGNKWSAIAAHFDGRTDNDIKNYWHAHIKKRRSNGSSRAMRIQNLAKEEQSSDKNSSTITTTGPNQDSPAQKTGVFESNADSCFNAAAAAADDDLYECLNNFDIDYHNFVEQGKIMMPPLRDSLDWEISPWNYSTAAKPVEEEDFFNVNFGDNFMSMFTFEHIYK